MVNIAVLVSGGGTNLQALIDAQNEGTLKSGRITLVVASKAEAFALTRAKDAGIATAVLPREPSAETYGQKLVALLQQHNIQLVVLAGFMLILHPCVIRAFAGRILNVHPSLIPAFCGAGYYGLRVHRAVLDYGVKVTGATVHLVNEIPDGGKILAQKAVKIKKGDTPETLQKRVMEKAEWKLLPRETEKLAKKIAKDGEQ